MQRFYSPITPIKITDNKETGLFYAFKAIIALKQEAATTAIFSAFNLFFKGLCHYGATEAEKQLLCEARPLIMQAIDSHVADLMPEFFTDEDKIRIVGSKGKSLQEQGEIMKAKAETLYKYPALLSLLFNLQPTIELREKLLKVASRAHTLGEKDFAPRLLSYLKAATITMKSEF